MQESLIMRIAALLDKLPLECMDYSFMQLALLAILLIAPLSAAAGVQVVNFRIAFFADAIGHSAFAGAALGTLLASFIAPAWTAPLLALLIGLGVMWLKRSSNLASDTVIGVFFALVVSGGLLLLSVEPELATTSQMFLFGDILMITISDILTLFILLILYSVFITFSFNKLLTVAVDEELSRAHRTKTAFYSYLHIAILSLIVICCVRIFGVLLVSSLLIVPAATARNLTSSAGRMFFIAIICGVLSGVSGLLISVQDWANTSAGAMIVMIGCIFFVLTFPIKYLAKNIRLRK